MANNRWTRLLRAVAAALGLTLGGASAADEQAARAWLERAFTEPDIFEALAGMEFTFEAVMPLRSEPGEIETLRERVRGYPDHPDRERLARLIRQRDQGPDTIRWRVWLGDERRWRVENVLTALPENASRSTSVKHPRHEWRLGGDTLQYSPGNTSHIAGVGIAMTTVEAEIVAMLGRIPAGPRPEATVIESFRLTGDRWTARIRYPHGRTAQLRGRWDDATRTGLLSETRFDPPDGSGTGARFTVSGWVYSDILGRWVAEERTYHDDAGVPQRITRLQSIRRLADGELDALLALPEPGGEDPILGPIRVRELVDERGTTEVRRTFDDDGNLDREERQTPSGVGARFRVLGWGLAIVLVALVIGLRVRAMLR